MDGKEGIFTFVEKSIGMPIEQFILITIGIGLLLLLGYGLIKIFVPKNNK